MKRIVGQIRQRWPEVKIILRADSGFCREELMAWCEAEPVHYVFGLARNSRLEAEIAALMAAAQREHQKTQQAARVFGEFSYQTRSSWSCARRVVAKAEYLDKGPNPRFVVTSLSPTEWEARALYEQLYCARGEMENRIKEQRNRLRRSTPAMPSKPPPSRIRLEGSGTGATQSLKSVDS